MDTAQCRQCGKELNQPKQTGIEPVCTDCFKKAMKAIGYDNIETKPFGHWLKQ